MNTSSPSICFVAQNAYNAVARRGDLQHIGGAETQQTLLARALGERGCRVSFVVLDHGQPDHEIIDGIHLYRSYRAGEGLPLVRFVYPRMSRLWTAMHTADADVYYQRGAESETGLVANWCRRHRRRFIFALAGHHMLTGDSVPPPLRERLLYRYGMRRADLILVQTTDQQNLLRRQFALESAILRNACTTPQTVEQPNPRNPATVLWVGRFDSIKRFDWCLEVAGKLPDLRFRIVGTANQRSAATVALQQRAARMPNVAFAGYIPPDRMHEQYRTASLLLCTSKSEGFSNTFLEAWSCGTPVVSTVDPDGIIEQHGLGRTGDNPAALATVIRNLLGDSSVLSQYARNAISYVQQYHGIDRIADELYRHLKSFSADSEKGKL